MNNLPEYHESYVALAEAVIRQAVEDYTKLPKWHKDYKSAEEFLKSKRLMLFLRDDVDRKAMFEHLDQRRQAHFQTELPPEQFPKWKGLDKMKKVCERCGQEYEPTGKTQKFCENCRTPAENAQIERNRQRRAKQKAQVEAAVASPPPVDSAVVSPPHYNTPERKECIVEMLEQFGKEAVISFCRLNAFKYEYRAQEKNGAEDLQKAAWYWGFLKAVEILAEDKT